MTSNRLHATTVAIDGRGVMITGPSGAGKSDLALRLIDRGAILVSDDYTECTTQNGVVIASPPATIAGRIEVRGIGIVDMPHLPRADVMLVVTLGETVERMPEAYPKRVAGIEIPAIALAAFEASAPIKVEIALSRLVEG
ncbi:MAG: HPr kinase [Sphingomonas bacterium]|uniref:HPr kinase/phosphorylase n=1 Tax=Sphingomonas bacterium TaxID=1895847 RepID=UPI00262E78F6|nr:aldolase [Sphingomonas bacterium]MDB5711016.1 HPr kinase [Sphingomonas bacterium]